MHFLKKRINGSPFVGIFCALSDTICLVPRSISKKDETELTQTLDVKVVKTSLASSSIIGVISVIFGDKVVVPEIVEKEEKKELEKAGMLVKQLNESNALGNLVALNSFGGIASTILSKNSVKEIEKFFEVKFVQKDICGSNLVGACIEATDKGFIVNPSVSAQEFEFLEKTLQVKGVPTTANYGDRFVGNDIIANNKGALIGSVTSTHEMVRIDEAFRRD